MADKTMTEQRYGLFQRSLFTSKVQKNFQRCWNDCVTNRFVVDEFPLTGCFQFCTVYPEPFRLCKIEDFIKDNFFLSDLMTEVGRLSHVQLTTDLYKFSRSTDLSEASGDNIQLLYRAFQVDLAMWLEHNTGIKLNTKVTMTSSRYYDTDYLLCHDDNMSRTRKIAFILYLNRDWKPYSGGSLDIFDTDEHGQPGKIINKIIPCYNSLVFFEVSDKSYHQVAEINEKYGCRWSINGWFHGPARDDRKEMSIRLWPEKVFSEPIAEINLKSWISGKYLSPNIIEEIHENVEEESHTFLEDFIEPSAFKTLAKACEAEDIIWGIAGPANIRRYEVANEETLPLSFKQFFNVLKSISFFRLLKQYTGLDLVPDEQTMRPKMTVELQRWSQGCYTVLYDTRKFAYSDSDSTKRVERPSDDESLTDSADDTSSMDAASPKRSNAKRSGQTSRNKRTKRDSTSSSDDTSEKIARSSDSQKDIANFPRTGKDEENAKSSRTSRKKRTKNRTFSSDGTSKKVPRCSDSQKDITDSPSMGEQEEAAESSRTNQRKRTRTSSTSSSDGTLEKVARCSDSRKDIADSPSTNEEEKGLKEPQQSDNDSSLGDDDTESVDSDDSDADYILDVILQFHTTDHKGFCKTQNTLDYMDPGNENGALMRVPQKDNHLLIAYRQTRVYRFHPYVNHLYHGYCYNLVCTYRE